MNSPTGSDGDVSVPAHDAGKITPPTLRPTAAMNLLPGQRQP
jgi:hypothetical protein